MIEFIRNKETGILEIWKDGIYQGNIITMGDELWDSNSQVTETKQTKNSDKH